MDDPGWVGLGREVAEEVRRSGCVAVSGIRSRDGDTCGIDYEADYYSAAKIVGV